MASHMVRWVTVRRLARLSATTAAVLLAVVSVPAPAAADAVQPAGSCVGTGGWQTGGFSESTAQLDREDVIEVPRADRVQWTGKVNGPAAGTNREVAGRIRLALPPLMGSIPIAQWSGSATDVERAGTYTYDLPSIVPAEVEFDLLASHDEGGSRHCSAAVGLVIIGGIFDGPLIWIALAGTLLMLVALALLGRQPSGGAGAGRAVLGGILGLLLGLFAAVTLILFGVIPLSSVLVDVILAAGLVLGAAWARWAPLGGGGPAPTPPEPVPPV